MTTVRHVSKCCSLGYSFNFSQKCPELVVPSSRFSSRMQSYAKTRITMLVTALVIAVVDFSQTCLLLTDVSPSFFSPANSTRATLSVIFHSCKF